MPLFLPALLEIPSAVIPVTRSGPHKFRDAARFITTTHFTRTADGRDGSEHDVHSEAPSVTHRNVN